MNMRLGLLHSDPTQPVVLVDEEDDEGNTTTTAYQLVIGAVVSDIGPDEFLHDAGGAQRSTVAEELPQKEAYTVSSSSGAWLPGAQTPSSTDQPRGV